MVLSLRQDRECARDSQTRGPSVSAAPSSSQPQRPPRTCCRCCCSQALDCTTGSFSSCRAARRHADSVARLLVPPRVIQEVQRKPDAWPHGVARGPGVHRRAGERRRGARPGYLRALRDGRRAWIHALWRAVAAQQERRRRGGRSRRAAVPMTVLTMAGDRCPGEAAAAPYHLRRRPLPRRHASGCMQCQQLPAEHSTGAATAAINLSGRTYDNAAAVRARGLAQTFLTLSSQGR